LFCLSFPYTCHFSNSRLGTVKELIFTVPYDYTTFSRIKIAENPEKPTAIDKDPFCPYNKKQLVNRMEVSYEV
jgi:hypothetical protein